MARSVTIRSIDRRAGVNYIRFGKSEVEIAGNLADVKAWVRSQFNDMDDEKLLALGLAVWLARDPSGANPGQLVGRTVTLDLSGRLTYPDAVVRVS